MQQTFWLSKLTEEVVLHQDLYKVEAGSLKEALDEVLENKVDPVKSRRMEETSEFTDWKEISHLVNGPNEEDHLEINVLYADGLYLTDFEEHVV